MLSLGVLGTDDYDDEDHTDRHFIGKVVHSFDTQADGWLTLAIDKQEALAFDLNSCIKEENQKKGGKNRKGNLLSLKF